MAHLVSPGQLIADRFLILRFIAEGGMGEVYEAEDQVLRENVALKFLSRHGIGDDIVYRRFRREVQLARKVTHANVCRLYDVFQFRPASGPLRGEEITFVTMELLEGETLEAYLEREGPLREVEALPLIKQVAAGLAAAHAVGVIHRDFKSNNVILVPSEHGAQIPRAVVTDFGLARSVTPSRSTSRTPLTGEMKILGTADYMAPEQLYGLEVSPASDVYSLGVVIFEMVTGAKPYSAPNPLALLTKRVNEPPASPRKFAPDLNRRWEAVIRRCLAEDPAHRFPGAWHVAMALEGKQVFAEPQSSGVLMRPAALKERKPSPRAPRWLWLLLLVLAIVVVVAVLLATRDQRRPIVPVAFSPEKLTTAQGLELDPAFSPDGTRVAFSSDHGGSFELYVRELPEGRESQLTADGDEVFEPAWSPDGERIAYHSARRGGIWVIAVGGGAASRVTEFGSRPAWSPDGERIAFQSESAPQLSDTGLPARVPSNLWVAATGDAAGSPRQLTAPNQPPGGHASPAWSPDGRRIVFAAVRRGSSEIWSIDREGEDLVPLVDSMMAFDPAYGPDGDRIYFSAARRQVNGLWALPVSAATGRPTGEPVQIANLGLASIRQIAVSQEGARMAYVAVATHSNLWSLALATPEPEPRALTAYTGRCSRPVFAPDGTRIAFDRWQHGVAPDVWIVGADGREARQVTSGKDNYSQPSWFPRGDRLAFLAIGPGPRSLQAVGLGGGLEEIVVDLESDVDWVTLSPDGTRLAYHSRLEGGSLNLWVMEIADQRRRQLTFAAEAMGFPCWSPDGEWLAFQRKPDENSYLMVIPSAGGEARQLTSEPGHSWPFSFSPDGDRIAFAAFRDGRWNLWWVSRTTGEQRQLTDFAELSSYVRYPAWSPQGDRIVFEKAKTTGDIWLVENLP